MNLDDIQTIGIIGAGQMGTGIAQVAAASGFRVLLTDQSLALSVGAKGRIAAILEKQVEKGKVPASERDELLARVEPAAGLDVLGAVDFVVEAATEDVERKLLILREVDRVAKPAALLASNTSSISITRLAGAVSRPAQVIGMHFMNPVPLMKLVEIVRALPTSDETYAVTKALAVRMGKTVITAKDHPGFVVNRLLLPLLNEACFAVQEGLATPEDIDAGVRLGLNHPMGPLELADFIGLDTVLAIADVMHGDFGDDKYRPAVLLRNLVAAGWLGKKSGRGFYRYDETGKRQTSTLSL